MAGKWANARWARRGARFAARLGFGVTLLLSGGAHADEGGVSFWLPGQYGSFAAIAPEAGFSMPLVTYGYSGSAGTNRALPLGAQARLGVDARFLGQLVIPTYSPEAEILGGRAAFWVGTMLATSDVSFSSTLGRRTGGGSQSVTGIGDLYPTAQIFWTKDTHNWMAYVSGGLPVGDYVPGRLTNIGLGRFALDVGGSYTFFDPSTGWEASATVGLTYNFENPHTHYTSGTSVHLDWAVSKFVSEQWQLGLAGFAYTQVSDDQGAPPVLGGFRSETYAVGPQVAYSTALKGRPVFINLRTYWEFVARNRTQGASAFLTVSLPF